MTRLPLEGYREKCDTKTVLGDGLGLVEQPIELDIPIYIAVDELRRAVGERQGGARQGRLAGRAR